LSWLQTLRESGTFVIVGACATGTHVVTALGTERLGLDPLYANLAGYCAAVGISYFGNAWLTFRRPALHGGQFVRFAVVSLLGLLLNQSIVYVLVKLAGWPLWAALIPTVVLVPAFTFTLSKLWAFRSQQESAPTAR
jgi:putative flippase GtrA